MKRISFVVLVTLVFVGSTVVASIAGVKTIKPEQLIPYGNQMYSIDSFGASGGTVDGYAFFYAKVKIPIGRTITKVKYYHQGQESGANTHVKLERGQMGGYIDQMAYLSPASDTGLIELEETNITFAKVQRGYIYQVRVFSKNVFSKIQGIKIYYK